MNDDNLGLPKQTQTLAPPADGQGINAPREIVEQQPGLQSTSTGPNVRETSSPTQSVTEGIPSVELPINATDQPTDKPAREKAPTALYVITGFWVLNLVSGIVGFSGKSSDIFSLALTGFIVLSLVLLITSRKSIAMTCVVVPTLLSAVATILSLGFLTAITKPAVFFRVLGLAFEVNPLGTAILLISIAFGIATPFYLSRLRKQGFVED